MITVKAVVKRAPVVNNKLQGIALTGTKGRTSCELVIALAYFTRGREVYKQRGQCRPFECCHVTGVSAHTIYKGKNEF